MTGHGSTECHFTGFVISHFTDQNDVRVLPHDRANTVAKVDLIRFTYRCLAHQCYRVLDWVFQGHDIDRFVVDER